MTPKQIPAEMPRKDDQELRKLKQENAAQRKSIAELSKQNQKLLRQIDELRQQIAKLQQQLQESLDGNVELREQLKSLQDKLDDLLIQLKDFRREKYGSTTEHHNPRQGETRDSDDAAEPEDEEVDLKRSRKQEKRPRNHKKHIKENAKNLPEKEVVHSVEDTLCPHCFVETELVSHKITSQLERLQQSLVALKHMQEFRACPKCDYVVTAEKPDPPFPGSYAGPCLLSSIIVDKFADALPNNRQAARFRRENAIIPRSTQCDWVIASSFTLEPLYELLKREILKSKVIQTDDSWIKIQDRRLKENMRKGKMTPYLGDKHHPYVVFDFSPDLSFKRNKEMLREFTGHVQCDASNGFDELFAEGSGKTELGCTAHSRRKYWKCKESYQVICEEILDIYHELYEAEREIKGQGAMERLSKRQSVSKPLTDRLRERILELKETLPPSNPLIKAVSYTLNHWEALVRFLDDPDFEIDNNRSERTIKQFVLMRKNSLFVGSDAGGRAAAIHLSFIATCKNLGIDPLTYLTDVFSRINSMKVSELDQLLPDRWARERAAKKGQVAPIGKPPP